MKMKNDLNTSVICASMFILFILIIGILIIGFF